MGEEHWLARGAGVFLPLQKYGLNPILGEALNEVLLPTHFLS
jgi:hypothetical protein